MQSPSGDAVASTDRDFSPSDRKRKRSSHQTRQASVSKQPTINSLFTGQSETCLNIESTTLQSKKPRSSTTTPSTARSLSNAIASCDMYAFASRSPAVANNGMVDLTKGPPHAPGLRFNPAPSVRAGMLPQRGAKKLVVKNLKHSAGWDSKAYLEKVWAQLELALDAIFANTQDGFSKEDLYRGVENVCKQGGAAALFSRLDPKCRAHVERDLRGSLLNIQSQYNVKLLGQVLDIWVKWKSQMVTVQAIFFFLDRSYLLSSSKPTLADMTLSIFRELIFEHPALKSKIVEGACELVAAERCRSDNTNGDLFLRAVNMFHDLSVYTASFEPRFLFLAQSYIADRSNLLIEEELLPNYIASANAIMAAELSRCNKFGLDASTKRDLLAILEDHLIERKRPDLTDYGSLKQLLDDAGSGDDLAALYTLLSRKRLGSELRPAFEKWIDRAGTSIVLAEESDDMVVRLLALKSRLDSLWQNAFQRDEALGHGLRDTFAAFINKTKKGESTWGTDNTKVGEMIAKYVDQLLRGGVKAIPDNLPAKRPSITAAAAIRSDVPEQEEDNEDPEIDEDEVVNTQLDQVLDLFRFLHGKAVFEAFYKKDLARRLLMGRSASADAERSMLTRLKTECGSQFTQNLEQMFKDIELAREEMQAYKQRLEGRIGYEKSDHVDLSVNILSAAAWPSYPDTPVNVPEKIQKAMADFELHYKSKHSGRKLDWKHALAHCQMRAVFGKGTKELVVSSFQAIVLLLFSGLADGDHLSYEHIRSETGLPEAEVKRTLQSLACAKLRPLTKHPKGREINATDTFTINNNFDHPKHRVKINQVQLKETKDENRETHQRVQEDRNFETQAAIVRILKSRKTIAHSELISEVIKATLSRGRLEVADIKKNIDRLIEKDYMEREEGNMYSYIA